MRQRRLVDSVRCHLPPETSLVTVVFMWRRRSWMAGYVACAGLAAVIVGAAADYGTWSTRAGLAACVAAFAALAATDQYVLVDTGGSLELLRASRIRQVAVASMGAISPSVPIDAVSSNLVITEWQIGNDRYSVPRRFGSAMTMIANR